jgi:hypothetical protein
MTYIRTGKRAHLSSLQIREQIAAAELAKEEAELAAMLEAERKLRQLQQRRLHVAAELQKAQERTTAARVQLALPPVIHGGREGLEAAAREADAWSKQRKEMSQQ